MDTVNEQIRMVLSDMQRDLSEVRRKRRETFDKLTELDSEEIEILLAIGKAKEALESLGEYVE